MTLAARLRLLLAGLAAVTALLLILFFNATLDRVVEDRIAERISLEMGHLARDLASVPAQNVDAFLRTTARDLACRITLIAPDGRVRNDTDLLPADVPNMENHAGRPEVREALARGSGISSRFSATLEENRIYLARRLSDGDILRMSVPASRVREIESVYVWGGRAAIIGACLLLYLVAAAGSKRFSAPIARLTRAASAIAAGDRNRELPRSRDEEVETLAASIQRMRDSLEQSAEEARAERRRTAMVFEQLPDGLVVVDSRLVVVDANARFSRMIGVTVVVGRPLYDLLRHRGLLEVFEATLGTGETRERTIALSDDLVWYVAAIPLPPGSRGAAIGVLRDVTRLERAESMRQRFVADVSHELRTPVASIAAAAETLAGGDVEEADSRELLDMIQRQTSRMAELIRDLMELAQIESGGAELQTEDVPVLGMFQETLRDFEPELARRRLRIKIDGADSITMRGDRRRLGQIVRNLLDNAVKFSPEDGTITFAAGREGGRAFFSISDEGLGIPRGEQDRIFQRFYQVDRSRSKARPGSGLGLAIVKHLVQLHGGEITVASEPGRGSTFRVSFPAGA
jgi:two-component system phosphate regulon sensor histidine kinase PhoR